jgi:hypothetical protein
LTPAPYTVTEFTILDFGVLLLTFADGLRGEVDLRGRLWGPVFERVRTPEGFREVYLDNGTVSWPGGADLAPDTLYERVRTGVWPEALPA